MDWLNSSEFLLFSVLNGAKFLGRMPFLSQQESLVGPHTSLTARLPNRGRGVTPFMLALQCQFQYLYRSVWPIFHWISFLSATSFQNERSNGMWVTHSDKVTGTCNESDRTCVWMKDQRESKDQCCVVWIYARERNYRCNLHSKVDAREIWV